MAGGWDGMFSRKQAIATGMGAICSVGLVLAGCGPQGGLTATVSQQVHPVLIRNDHNVLLRLVIDSKRASPVSLRSLEVSLEGTDDLGDLESLEVYRTGAKQEFAADARFSPIAQPSAQVSFRGEQPLQPGANVFWLSCRLKPAADLSHKVAARLTAIETSEGSLALAGQPNPVRRRIGIALRKHND
ncbi:MAG: hypothetical protein FJW37_09720, partial [Acidobacteria bacterium]|nr:hypothetical protein [Acidobacteriota bacterium]